MNTAKRYPFPISGDFALATGLEYISNIVAHLAEGKTRKQILDAQNMTHQWLDGYNRKAEQLRGMDGYDKLMADQQQLKDQEAELLKRGLGYDPYTGHFVKSQGNERTLSLFINKDGHPAIALDHTHEELNRWVMTNVTDEIDAIIAGVS
jgi:hypothetical protein